MKGYTKHMAAQLYGGYREYGLNAARNMPASQHILKIRFFVDTQATLR
jgi:hypothetical protein